MKQDLVLKDFVESLEMTVLEEEDAILLDGMVGTSNGPNRLCNTDKNCGDSCANNCQGGNCVTGCGAK